MFNLGLQLKTEELYRGLVRRDSVWDKLLFWLVRQKVRIEHSSTHRGTRVSFEGPKPMSPVFRSAATCG